MGFFIFGGHLGPPPAPQKSQANHLLCLQHSKGSRASWAEDGKNFSMAPKPSDHGQDGARLWANSSSVTPRKAPLTPDTTSQVPEPSLHSGPHQSKSESVILAQALLGLILETALPELHPPGPLLRLRIIPKREHLALMLLGDRSPHRPSQREQRGHPAEALDLPRCMYLGRGLCLETSEDHRPASDPLGPGSQPSSFGGSMAGSGFGGRQAERHQLGDSGQGSCLSLCRL